jgi:acetyl esterase/lipase
MESQIAAALAQIPGAGDPSPALGDWKARRTASARAFAHVNSLVTEPTDVWTVDHWAPTPDGSRILLRWYQRRPAQVSPHDSPAVVFLHGGAMILGSVEAYDTTIKNYVAASGVPMLAVDYRLAPEHPHPTPVEDCYTALTWLAAQAGDLGVDPARIAIMGDSAGGGLAAAVSLLARDRRGPRIAHQILLCPMLDDRTIRPDPALGSLATFTYDDNTTGWLALLGHAAGGDDVPGYAAPARADDLRGLPPVYMDVGQVDILCDQDIAYARRLSAAGVGLELHVHPGAPHAFELYAPAAGISRRAMSDRIRMIRSL